MMKRLVALVALAVAGAPAFAATTNVTISVGQPGFYGRLDVGGYPQPQFLYAEPLIVQPAPVGVVRQPVYLYVPAGQAKEWRKHCKKYNACGQPVYFVQENWYREVYVPSYRERKGHDKEGKGKNKEGKVKKQH